MAQLFNGIELQKRDGSKHNPAEVLKDKVVGIYFSAHWCPPCRMFTPVLKDFYGDLEDTGDFEVVFVSFDRSAKELNDYLAEAHGDWYHVPFGSDKIKELSQQFSVSGIPALIILKPDGTVITNEGRATVQSSAPKTALASWKS